MEMDVENGKGHPSCLLHIYTTGATGKTWKVEMGTETESKNWERLSEAN